MDLVQRPRRLRATAALRRLTQETRWAPAELVLPMFVREGAAEPTPIPAMPGVVQHSMRSLRAAAREAQALGLGGIMLFGVPEHRDSVGSGADAPGGILNRALGELRAELGGDFVVMADLCLDEFTDHGHCGVLSDGRVDNDATVRRYAEVAVAQAAAGAQVLGLSGMMDGQVGAVRAALDSAGYLDVVLLAYSAKYASAFYGPFRDAVESPLQGDRRSYQQDPANAAEALREVRLDIEQGADIVMVKPALPYLDILRRIADEVSVPVAAYQVSGEYSMIEAAAAAGMIDREAAIAESLTSIRRAGASIQLTYWAAEVARGV
ncbi:MAG: porphobilinogen synthase [Angustibacter sp.]